MKHKCSCNYVDTQTYVIMNIVSKIPNYGRNSGEILLWQIVKLWHLANFTLAVG